MPLSGGAVVLVAAVTIDLLEAGLKVENSQNSAKENGGERSAQYFFTCRMSKHGEQFCGIKCLCIKI